ncbi:hypothetical protein H2248_009161 [Termitomyces sp. 'cryptogamus']|nr:hypothetical protein H2248_009161 [Termitomyces sp. 'cryptogamus']
MEEAVLTTASISSSLEANSGTLSHTSNKFGASITPCIDPVANMTSASSVAMAIAEKSVTDNTEETPIKNSDQEMYDPNLDPKLAKLATPPTNALSD